MIFLSLNQSLKSNSIMISKSLTIYIGLFDSIKTSYYDKLISICLSSMDFKTKNGKGYIY